MSVFYIHTLKKKTIKQLILGPSAVMPRIESFCTVVLHGEDGWQHDAAKRFDTGVRHTARCGATSGA